MNPVVHFEMPYDNRERIATFYESAFGWQTQKLGEDMGNYVLATTTQTDESGPQQPGAINGGFFSRNPNWPALHPSIVIAVDGLSALPLRARRTGRFSATGRRRPPCARSSWSQLSTTTISEFSAAGRSTTNRLPSGSTSYWAWPAGSA